MNNDITFREIRIIIKQAIRNSDNLFRPALFMTVFTFIGLFVDFRFSIMAFLFTIPLHLLVVLVGIKNLEIKVANGTLPEEYLDELLTEEK